MRKNWGLITIFIFLGITTVFIYQKTKQNSFIAQNSKFWQMQAVDTVKYSRDLAGQYLDNSTFDSVIEKQVNKIAETGATHIALGTPYDQRFVPFLKRWVNISRSHGLKIWFRGNFSGWEKWFNEKPITREEHKKLLEEFIKNNGDLFADGDFFTSCTECENGGPGDPRKSGDIDGFRQFLISEYQITKNSFRLIDKNVNSNYFPMNYDVATLIMNRETTDKLGGVVVIDHYVSSSEKTNDDATKLANSSGGKIVIGEFGAPIPDIHGEMTQEEQSDWIYKTLFLLSQNKNIIGVNYWTGFGGSTKLWDDDGSNRKAADTLKEFFTPRYIKGYVIDETGKPIDLVELKFGTEIAETNKLGQFTIPVHSNNKLVVTKDGYYQKQAQNLPTDKTIKITLIKKNPNFVYNLQKKLYNVIISL